MSISPHRRQLVIAGGLSLLASGCAVIEKSDHDAILRQKLAELEGRVKGRLGVMVMGNAGGTMGHRVGYRDNERFPMCSTFKVVLVGAILNRSLQDSTLLARRVKFNNARFVPYSPVTEKALVEGMTILQLCEAAIKVGDNTATNVLIQELGGPQAVTAYARQIGDVAFRLDRMETELNSAEPGDERDTTTPESMAMTLQKLVLGEFLPPLQRRMLVDWMQESETGRERIRAGMPKHWYIGDKTGSGAYGTTNDIAVIWPENAPPIVLTVYYTQEAKEAEPRSDVIAIVADLVNQHFLAHR